MAKFMLAELYILEIGRVHNLVRTGSITSVCHISMSLVVLFSNSSDRSLTGLHVPHLSNRPM